tara:strand:- start:1465 stop:1944 length:480 start_codon:yes stop_codon:yes gene_type:complete
MRSVLLIFFFLIFSDRTLSSDNFSQVPLSSFIESNSENEESLTENIIYESTRCSALFAWISELSANLNSEKGRKLEKKSLFNSKSLTGVALQTFLTKTTDQSNLDEINLEINNLIEKRIMNYQADGEIIKDLKGGYLKGYIKEDLKICNIMIEAYKETF